MDYNLHAHLVFTSKYRRGPFTSAILDRCEQIMTEVCADYGAEPREFNGETDHAHLLVHIPPEVRCHVLVNSLKGCFRRPPAPGISWPYPQIPIGRTLLVPSYFTGSWAGAPLSIVKDYIENQKRPT